MKMFNFLLNVSHFELKFFKKSKYVFLSHIMSQPIVHMPSSTVVACENFLCDQLIWILDNSKVSINFEWRWNIVSKIYP